MQLKVDLIMKRSDIAEFFEITSASFSKNKQKYLNELQDYCDYELDITPKGNLRSITVTKVYCDTYYKSYKDKFIRWFKENDVQLMTAEDGLSNLKIVVNAFCQLNEIPYDGPHRIKNTFEGKTYDNKRKISEDQLIDNPQFQTWNYLYRLARRKFGQGQKQKDWVPMKSGVWNPVYIMKRTKEDEEIIKKIQHDIFGNQTNNFLETMEEIDDMPVDNMSAAEMKSEIMALRSVRDMTDQQKLDLYYKRLEEAELLPFKGYHYDREEMCKSEENYGLF